MTRVPYHIALAKWAHPLGPRAEPSAADVAKARRFFAEHYEADPNVSRKWIEAHRDKSEAAFARMVMQQRLEREWRVRNDPEQERTKAA